MEIFFVDEKSIEDAFYIRKEVFVKEQNIPECVEYDGSDKYAKNIVLKIDNKPIGTGRLIHIDNKMYIGRLAVIKQYRKNGYAKKMVEFLINEVKNMGYKEVFIHAQEHAKNFYENLGFKSFGDTFLEANIPHINMKIDI